MKSLEKASWYARRLFAMSGPEIAHRGREAVRRRAGKHLTRRAWKPSQRDAKLPELPGFREGLRSWDVPQALIAEWQEHADDAASGALLLLGQRWPAKPLHERWHLDPVTGRNWPADIYCHDIDFRHQSALGDVKYVWELSRLQYLQPIAALAFRTREQSLARLCAAHVESWIDHNPFAMGIAWASGIELAMRSVSLIVVASLVGDWFTPAQCGKFCATLQAHGVWLERFPSLYSSANNHRIAEGLGLLLIGALCPTLPHAGTWRDHGWSILCQEAPRQILPDGVGAEQSVTYTGMVLEMLLLGLVIARHAELPIPEIYIARLTAAGEWLRWCTDAAGNLPRIGDDDNARVIGAYRADESHTNSVLCCVAAMLGLPQLTPPGYRAHLRHAIFGFPPNAAPPPQGLRVFGSGGYTVARRRVARRDVLLAFDHGELGYLSIAAHGHADALAVWLHLDGQPVLVDAGTFLYHAGRSWRQHFRSTAAHNTLRVERTEGSIQAGNFNWSHKARARLVDLRSDARCIQVEAGHDGYRGRFGAIHRRRIEFLAQTGEIIICDWLEAPRPLEVEINFLLHPHLQARLEDGFILMLGDRAEPLVRLAAAGALIPEIIGPEAPGGWYSPGFNIKQPTTRLCWRGVLHPGEQQRTCLQIVPSPVRHADRDAPRGDEHALGSMQGVV